MIGIPNKIINIKPIKGKINFHWIGDKTVSVKFTLGLSVAASKTKGNKNPYKIEKTK